MALTKSLFETKPNFEGELELADAYWRVTEFQGNKNQISFTVSVSADSSSEVVQVNRYAFAPVLDGGNFIKQAYLHLKSLPEFSDAVDC